MTSFKNMVKEGFDEKHGDGMIWPLRIGRLTM